MLIQYTATFLKQFFGVKMAIKDPRKMELGCLIGLIDIQVYD